MGRLFQLQEYCLRAMGHKDDMDSTDSTALSLKHISSLIFVISAQYPLISYVAYNRNDMEKVTACLSVVFTNMLTVIKISTFLANRKDFWEMIHRFRKMHEQSASHIPRYREGLDYVAEANKLASFLGRAYCVSCGLTGLYFMLGPIVKIGVCRWHGTTCDKELPMPMKFPFNDLESPGYEVCFLYTVLVTVVVVAYASAVDGLFISFAINLRAHFQTLQRQIENWEFPSSEPDTQIRLKSIVEYHVLLLSLSRKLRSIYTPTVMGQFVITSLQVGVIIYQLVTNMDSVMDLLLYASFFGSIMLQLFIYCYGGEIIKAESLQVDTAVRLSNWHLASPKTRTSLSLIILQSQKEVLIRAGFFVASLANFVGICRTALSLITLIKSIE
uniref:Odorant receptor 82a n=1 Tax=Drosophila melanogaster TaxID=7227 RepID=OR82A_DROME|nr:odorant receptor 82a [Drosophila melanogaster]P82986.1 RecName: Full=Odorant receptor 82a [Drosophila melanogaster]AAN13335.1 odorant receptor 82a [Drosophila melanogaster]|eukprot:NP_730794.1 odorant receptor 82a [Drosophila melanogaster]